MHARQCSDKQCGKQLKQLNLGEAWECINAHACGTLFPERQHGSSPYQHQLQHWIL